MRQILHLSDVHFGPPHRDEVSEGVHQFAERRQPDLVIISGDLTQRAKPEQFRQARAFVDRFTAPTLTVPGNHDVPMYRVWERVLSPFGAYRKHFATELEPTFEDEELLVVGVNSAFNWTIKDGRVTGTGLRRLRQRLAAGDASRTRIVVAHHPLVPAPRFDSRRVLGNAHAMVDLLVESDVELVLSGHLHQAWIETTESYYPSGRRPVLLAHSGTSTSSRGRGSERGRNTCNWLQLGGDDVEITRLGWHPESGSFQVWSQHRYPRRHRRDNALETF